MDDLDGAKREEMVSYSCSLQQDKVQASAAFTINRCITRPNGYSTAAAVSSSGVHGTAAVIITAVVERPGDESRHTGQKDGMELHCPLPLRARPAFFCFFLVSIVTFTFREVLPSANLWASHGHRCRSFSPPPAREFVFIAPIVQVQRSHFSSVFLECC